MSRFLRVLCLAGLAYAGALRAADSVQPGSHPDSSGWKDLFAADLSDALYPQGIWTFANGELTASKDECIFTKDVHENFVLDLEFKMGDAANSGVVLYCSDRGNWIPNSVEVQILDDYSPKWAKAAANWKCGGLFGHTTPKKQVVKKAGEWNRMTLWCKGPSIRVLLNGELVTEADLKEWTSTEKNPDGSKIPAWLNRPLAGLATRGYIGLQGKHGGAPIFFRSMKIKPME